MSDEQRKIQQLTYALGLAIGALETVNLVPYDFNKGGVENVLRRIKEITESAHFFVTLPKKEGGNG